MIKSAPVGSWRTGSVNRPILAAVAEYALYIGGAQGHALLDKKQRSRLPDDALGLDDQEVLRLGVSPDPYVSSQLWFGLSLATLRQTVESRLAALRSAPTQPATVRNAEKLLELTVRAEAEFGTLVFWGD